MLTFKGNTFNSRILRSGANRVRLTLIALIAVLALTLTVSPALAQTSQDPSDTMSPTSKPSTEPSLDDKRELEAFMDGVVKKQLESSKIPGATVSVVKDGEVLLAKGYGEADVEAEKPVVADETLFRVGSVSKLFTSTAVMQLVEEGKLDLDEDVNTYLDDVEIPETYPGKPVTLRHLLTHTAGFEQEFVGTGARGADDFKPLGEYLSENVPARVKPPGEVTSYSNFGMALAGHIVGQASGMTYAPYVEENVAGPLGMDSTTAAQPPAPELHDRLAKGYVFEDGEPVADSFEHIEEAPAGAVSSTAPDMARFMIAHLQNGRYGDARILEENTAKEMHETQFSNDPRLDGQDFGFYEQTINGEHVIEHGGNTDLYHSMTALLPDRDVGIFVSYNSYGEGGDLAEYELTDAFMDRYYPEEAASSAPESSAEASGEADASVDSGSSGNAEQVAGNYSSTRSNYTGFEKVVGLLGSTSVTANGDGSITTSGLPTREDLMGGEQRWVEDGPMLFRAEGRDEHIAFGQDKGSVTYLSTDADPSSAFEKLPSYASPKLHQGLLAGSLVVFLLTALVWPVGALISRWYKRRSRKLHGEPGDEPERGTGGARIARPVAWTLCAFALLLTGVVSVTVTNQSIMYFGDSPLISAIRVLPFPVAALAVGVVVLAVLSWKCRYWGLFGRLHYTLVALAALPFIALLGYYNLLGL